MCLVCFVLLFCVCCFPRGDHFVEEHVDDIVRTAERGVGVPRADARRDLSRTGARLTENTTDHKNERLAERSTVLPGKLQKAGAQ